MTEMPPDSGLRLGPVRRPPQPEAPSTPSVPEETVRLRPAEPQGDDRTVMLRPAAPQAADEETFRLAPPVADPAATVQLGPVPPVPAGPDAEQTVRIEPAETVLAPAPTPVADAVPADAALRRYGPGVPPLAAAVWHGEGPATEPEPPRRRWDRWLLIPLVLLLTLLGYLLWDRYGRSVEVVGVAAVAQGGPTCDGTAVIAGVLETDGGEGDVTYRWVRSDGTDSGPITQHVLRGRHRTEVTLRWTFQGQGEAAATARLEVLEPSGGRTAEAAFTYSCP
ncbi:hypothetical protein [Kitasatospora sp. NPDC088134]|uniref:hypothetical protein n=1 Tax=Kitasatospora sp. NPDC088134 TaxID=3364071 RepID=UPI00380749E9